MTSATNQWQISDYQALRQDACIYGPEFQVGDYYFQLQLHPNANAWPEPGALYLSLIPELGSPPQKLFGLKVRATFRVEQLQYQHTLEVKDTLARWQGGFGPQDPRLRAALATAQGAGLGRLDFEVRVEVLEEETPSTTLFRWPIERFEDLRVGHAQAPCRAGFHAYHSRRFEVCGLLPAPLAFRVELHPCIDATGNFYVSLRLDKGAPNVEDMKLRFDLEIEELAYSMQSELLEGNLRTWSRSMGVAAHPTACEALRAYTGPATLKLRVSVTSFALARPKTPSVWSDFVSPEFRYLLLTAAGEEVAGQAEPMQLGELSTSTFAAACSCNVNMMQSLLLESGVPSERIRAFDFGGEAEQPHPRELLEDFVRNTADTSKLVVYFAGHATKEGAWCFRWRPHGQRYAADVTVSPQELFAWKVALQPNTSRVPLEVLAESVSAGAWCLAAKRAQLQGRVFAACAPEGHAWTTSHGSLFTSWITGRGPPPTALGKVHAGLQQEPWECTRLGAAGPVRIPGGAASGKGPAVSPLLLGSTAASLTSQLPAVTSPAWAAPTSSWPTSPAARSPLASQNSTGWGMTIRRPPSAGRRLLTSR